MISDAYWKDGVMLIGGISSVDLVKYGQARGLVGLRPDRYEPVKRGKRPNKAKGK